MNDRNKSNLTIPTGNPRVKIFFNYGECIYDWHWLKFSISPKRDFSKYSPAMVEWYKISAHRCVCMCVCVCVGGRGCHDLVHSRAP